MVAARTCPGAPIAIFRNVRFPPIADIQLAVQKQCMGFASCLSWSLGIVACSGVSVSGFAQPPQPDSELIAPPIVFFDCASTDLSPLAIQLLHRAYEDFVMPALRGEERSLVAFGHTDRVGSSAENQLLGMRRAEAVRNYLVARGVPQSRISVRSFGEDRPLVETEDEVREPQNCRVELLAPLSR